MAERAHPLEARRAFEAQVAHRDAVGERRRVVRRRGAVHGDERAVEGRSDVHQPGVVGDGCGAQSQQVDGIAELHFRTREDFDERFYDSDEGRRIIRDDVKKFIDVRAGEAALMTEIAVRNAAPND